MSSRERAYSLLTVLAAVLTLTLTRAPFGWSGILLGALGGSAAGRLSLDLRYRYPSRQVRKRMLAAMVRMHRHERTDRLGQLPRIGDEDDDAS